MSEPRVITFVTPLPPKALAQGRKHWRTEWKARKDMRHEFYLLGLSRKSEPPIERYRVHITLQKAVQGQGSKFYCPTDPDNAAWAIKAAIDGLVDSGLLAGDKSENRQGCQLTNLPSHPDTPQGQMIIKITEAIGESQ